MNFAHQAAGAGAVGLLSNGSALLTVFVPNNGAVNSSLPTLGLDLQDLLSAPAATLEEVGSTKHNQGCTSGQSAGTTCAGNQSAVLLMRHTAPSPSSDKATRCL